MEKAADVESPTDFADELILSWQARQQLNGTRPVLSTITPMAWKNTNPSEQRWLAGARIPASDLTIMSGNGGSGKTEIALQLLVYMAAGLQDWLGCTIESGVGLLLSCEEPEENVRDRVERICKHRGIDSVGLGDLHMVFPDLDQTWLATVDRFGRMTRTPLLDQIEVWIEAHRPRLLVIELGCCGFRWRRDRTASGPSVPSHAAQDCQACQRRHSTSGSSERARDGRWDRHRQQR